MTVGVNSIGIEDEARSGRTAGPRRRSRDARRPGRAATNRRRSSASNESAGKNGRKSASIFPVSIQPGLAQRAILEIRNGLASRRTRAPAPLRNRRPRARRPGPRAGAGHAVGWMPASASAWSTPRRGRDRRLPRRRERCPAGAPRPASSAAARRAISLDDPAAAERAVAVPRAARSCWRVRIRCASVRPPRFPVPARRNDSGFTAGRRMPERGGARGSSGVRSQDSRRRGARRRARDGRRGPRDPGRSAARTAGLSVKLGFLAVMRADSEELADGEDAQNLYFRRLRLILGAGSPRSGATSSTPTAPISASRTRRGSRTAATSSSTTSSSPTQQSPAFRSTSG